jgi:hypothetical protein
VRVVVADDLMLTREGIVRLLRDADVDVVGEAGSRLSRSSLSSSSPPSGVPAISSTVI